MTSVKDSEPKKRIGFIGLDPSLRNFAVVTFSHEEEFDWVCFQPKSKGIDRLYEQVDLIQNVMTAFLNKHDIVYAGIEGYAYAAGKFGSRSVFDLGEIVGCLKYYMYANRMPYKSYGIQRVKKFYAFKGNASKDLMKIEGIKLWDAGILFREAKPSAFEHLNDAKGVLSLLVYDACQKGVMKDIPNKVRPRLMRLAQSQLDVLKGEEDTPFEYRGIPPITR